MAIKTFITTVTWKNAIKKLKELHEVSFLKMNVSSLEDTCELGEFIEAISILHPKQIFLSLSAASISSARIASSLLPILCQYVSESVSINFLPSLTLLSMHADQMKEILKNRVKLGIPLSHLSVYSFLDHKSFTLLLASIPPDSCSILDVSVRSVYSCDKALKQLKGNMCVRIHAWDQEEEEEIYKEDKNPSFVSQESEGVEITSPIHSIDEFSGMIKNELHDDQSVIEETSQVQETQTSQLSGPIHEVSDKKESLGPEQAHDEHEKLTESEFVKLAAERDQLDTQREAIASERDQLDTQREAIASERDQLDTQREAIASERDQLDTQREAIASERDQLAKSLKELEMERASVTDSQRVLKDERERIESLQKHLEEEQRRIHSTVEQQCAALEESLETQFAKEKSAFETEIEELHILLAKKDHAVSSPSSSSASSHTDS
ncbi:hypothetical protein ADUPG1_012041, partial [Aduncisulcus paluster]